jgi:hypothetical protein
MGSTGWCYSRTGRAGAGVAVVLRRRTLSQTSWVTMANARTPVPSEISVEVLFTQNHTCCVCRERGKTVQLHHIDEDPTNHLQENLAVLCLEDHERTQLRGGFGKKLLAPEVKRYRDDWIERVKKRREKADELAVAAMRCDRIPNADKEANGGEWAPPPHALLTAYVEHLPALRRAAYENARNGWDTGVTSEMRRATYEVIDIFERVLVYLAAWYSPKHFDGQGAASYFSEYISSRYRWHRACQEPAGPGSGGTIVGVLVGGDVLDDVSSAIANMVEALSPSDIDLIKWRTAWNSAGEPVPSGRESC